MKLISNLLFLCILLNFNKAISQSSIYPPVGSATSSGPDCFQLTNNAQYIVGAIWFDPQTDLSQPFDIRVKLNFGTNFQWDGSDVSQIYPEAGGGADGIAFVMQQVSSAAGNLGEAMGYGLLNPSISVEFDTYYNFNADPIYDHIAISKNGLYEHTEAPFGNFSEGVVSPNAMLVPALGTDPVTDNIQTGNYYEARFTWNPATTELAVWFDCNHKFTFTEDIVNTIFNGNSNVYYGFTSATGSEFNEHSICVIYNSNQFDLPDTTICQGESVQLNGELVNADAANTTYSWSPATGLSNPNIANPIAAPNTTTQYVLTIQQSCYADPIIDTVNITVNSGNPVSIYQAGPFCLNDNPVNLSATSNGGFWSGNGITDNNNGVFSPTSAGVGLHNIVYKINGNCGGTDTISILIYEPPTPVFDVSDTIGCAPLAVTFMDLTLPAGTNCFWDFGDGTTSTDCGSVNHVYTIEGCYDISLTLSQGNGCSATTTIDDMVCVTPSPIANFNYNPQVIEIPHTDVQFTNLSTDATSYNWNFAGLNSSTNENPLHTFPNQTPGTYNVCLAAENDEGCTDEICKEIAIKGEFHIYVPNAFTPNNDNKNNIFKPIILGISNENYELMIFNRWGELIYNSTSTTAYWDGYYKGRISKDDVYVWKIKLKVEETGEKKEYYGHVSLLK